MLIRSQDRKALTKFDFISICPLENRVMFNFDEDKSVEMRAFVGYRGNVIGTYSTEEKAVKVLDMIQEEFLKTTEILLSRDIAGRCLPKAVVFEMPQDEDIEDG